MGTVYADLLNYTIYYLGDYRDPVEQAGYDEKFPDLNTACCALEGIWAAFTYPQ